MSNRPKIKRKKTNFNTSFDNTYNNFIALTEEEKEKKRAHFMEDYKTSGVMSEEMEADIINFMIS